MGFTDMMSSGRGPGLIGMLLALLVVVGFGTLYVFVFDEGLQGGDQSIEGIIASQQKEIDGYNVRIKNAGERLAVAPEREAARRELVAVNQEIRFRGGELEGLRQNAASAEESLSELRQRFEDYKNEYREFARKGAAGTKIERLETSDGKLFANVEIRRVDAVGMDIRHDDGHTRVLFDVLPENLRDHFQFDPKQKEEALAAEQGVRAELEAAVAVANAAEDKRLAEFRRSEQERMKHEAKQRLAQTDARIAQAQRDLRGLQNELAKAESQKAAMRASGRAGIDRTGDVKGKISRKRAEIQKLQAEAQRLRSQS